jgi:hypothetical protein
MQYLLFANTTHLRAWKYEMEGDAPATDTLHRNIVAEKTTNLAPAQIAPLSLVPSPKLALAFFEGQIPTINRIDECWLNPPFSQIPRDRIAAIR